MSETFKDHKQLYQAEASVTSGDAALLTKMGETYCFLRQLAPEQVKLMLSIPGLTKEEHHFWASVLDMNTCQIRLYRPWEKEMQERQKQQAQQQTQTKSPGRDDQTLTQ